MTENLGPDNSTIDGSTIDDSTPKNQASDVEETIKRVPFSEILYGLVFSPAKTYALFNFYKPWGLAFIFLVVTNIILILLNILDAQWQTALSELPESISSYLLPMRTSFGLFLGILLFPISVLFFMIYTSFLHLLAEMLGGKGGALALFTAFAFTQILSIFSALINFFASFLGKYNHAISTPLAIAITIWQIALYTIAVREIHHISTARSILVVFLPLLLMLMIIFFMITVGIAFFLPLLEGLNTLSL